MPSVRRMRVQFIFSGIYCYFTVLLNFKDNKLLLLFLLLLKRTAERRKLKQSKKSLLSVYDLRMCFFFKDNLSKTLSYYLTKCACLPSFFHSTLFIFFLMSYVFCMCVSCGSRIPLKGLFQITCIFI